VVDGGRLLTRLHDTMILRTGSFHCTLNLTTAADAVACVQFLLRALSHSTYPRDVRFSVNDCDTRCPRLSSVVFLPAAGAESLFGAGQYCSGTRAIAIGGDDGIGCAVGTDASQPGWRVVIAQVLATLRAIVRYCDVRYLKTERGSERGVAKDGFDGGGMVNASGSGCEGAGGDDVVCGGNVGGCGEVRDANDARRSWVLMRESRGHEDRGRRAHGRWIGGRVEDFGSDYWVEEREMCCRL
jgi:hypothetical protein